MFERSSIGIVFKLCLIGMLSADEEEGETACVVGLYSCHISSSLSPAFFIAFALPCEDTWVPQRLGSHQHP